jgi:carbon storage regulator
MLVLSRREGQKIIIGKNIQIELLRINGNQASLGVSAPSDVSVHREEIQQRIDLKDSQIRI